MSALSQNNWRVLDRSELVWFTAAGERFAAANADVAVCATELIEQFNAHVERLAGPVLDDWSWASRPVRGQATGFSNHASATAWDLNATQHARDVHGTFTGIRIAAVRKILATIVDGSGRKVFRWGADYVDAPVDAMHFEIHATPDQVAQAARKIRARRPAPPPQESPLSTSEVAEIKAAIAAVWTTPVVPYNQAEDRTAPVDPKRPLRTVPSMLEQCNRLARRHDAQIAAQGRQIAAQGLQFATLAAAVSATLAATSPAGVKDAFDAGVAELRQLLSQVDITVTTDGG